MNQNSGSLFDIEKRIKFSIYILTLPSLPNNFPSHSSKEKKKILVEGHQHQQPPLPSPRNRSGELSTSLRNVDNFPRVVCAKRDKTRENKAKVKRRGGRERETYNSIAAGVNNEPEPDSYGIGGVTSLCSLSRIIRPARVSRIISRVLPK